MLKQNFTKIEKLSRTKDSSRKSRSFRNFAVQLPFYYNVLYSAATITQMSIQGEPRSIEGAGGCRSIAESGFPAITDQAIPIVNPIDLMFCANPRTAEVVKLCAL